MAEFVRGCHHSLPMASSREDYASLQESPPPSATTPTVRFAHHNVGETLAASRGCFFALPLLALFSIRYRSGASRSRVTLTPLSPSTKRLSRCLVIFFSVQRRSFGNCSPFEKIWSGWGGVQRRPRSPLTPSGRCTP